MNSTLLLVVCLVIVSYALTFLVMKFSVRKKILDIPNERSSHSIPTPRGGGLAIVISWYSGISILFMMGLVDRNLYFALLSGIILAIISLVDDLFDLKPSIRLIGQIVTVIIAFILLGGIKPVYVFNNNIIPAIILYPVAIVGMVWFINLYNFLDGIDGYASIEAIALAIGLFVFTGQPVSLILLASVLGFIIWNWPKARIFMGDVGSTQLGFIVVVLGIYFHNENQFPIICWLIFTAPFWFDATLTLFRRWRNHEKLSQAHRKHIYQRLVQSGYSHQKVDIYLTLLNIFLILLVFLCSKYNKLQIPLFLVTLILMYLITLFTDKRKQF
jgi:UDP-N-acetylmuramyl pentapeptide phosphotransferase/UDP-N-acetylglucosamine-1-phosphate transferase